MDKSKDRQNGGIGVIGLLGVAFVVLKLTGYIDWSWWWVTAPFWGGIAIALLIVLICSIGIGLMELYEKRSKRK